MTTTAPGPRVLPSLEADPALNAAYHTFWDKTKSLAHTKTRLRYIRSLFIWLLDSKPPGSGLADWKGPRSPPALFFDRGENEKEFRDTILAIVVGEWAPGAGRNHLIGWKEFAAVTIGLNCLTREAAHLGLVDSAVLACKAENDDLQKRMYQREQRSLHERQEMVASTHLRLEDIERKDTADEARWTKTKEWMHGLGTTVPDMLALLDDALTKSNPAKAALFRVSLRGIPVPPGHTTAAQRLANEREQRARELADDDGFDLTDVAGAAGPAHEEPDKEPDDGSDDGSETGDEADRAPSPVLEIGEEVPDTAPAPVLHTGERFQRDMCEGIRTLIRAYADYIEKNDVTEDLPADPAAKRRVCLNRAWLAVNPFN